MNRRKQLFILMTICLLAIGFATLSATLYMTSGIIVTTDISDFDVYFSGVEVNGVDKSNDVIINKKQIVFEPKILMYLYDNLSLMYEITNNSKLYDADVTVSCNLSKELPYVKIEQDKNKLEIKAGKKDSGNINVYLDAVATEEDNLMLTCNLVANAIERTTFGDDVEPMSDYSLTGYFTDKEGNIIPDANLVVYSDTPHYTKTDRYGYFYVDGLERGVHEIYYIEEEPQTMTYEEIKANALTKINLSTNNKKNIIFSDDYKIIETEIKVRDNKTYEISFDSDGGNEINSISITENSYYTNLPIPIKTEYDFIGWYLEDILVDDDTYVKESTSHTLKAKWSKILSPTITLGNDSWTNTSQTISVEEEGTAHTGVDYYEYYTSTITTLPTASTTGTIGDSITISDDGITYVYFRTISKGGAKSNWTNASIVKIDTTTPTVELNSSLPLSVTMGDSYEILGNYSLGTYSDGTINCLSDVDGEVTNTSTLAKGTHEITCIATTGAGLTATASATITITWKAYSATNLIKNGSFENGFNNWTINSSYVYLSSNFHPYGSYSYARKPATYDSYGFASTTFSIINGHKYFFKATGFSDESNKNKQSIRVDIINVTPYPAIKIGYLPGQTKNISSIVTASMTNSATTLNLNVEGTSGITYVDGVIIIDLTAVFGSGKEPTKEWCNNHINYFDGTSTIYK